MTPASQETPKALHLVHEHPGRMRLRSAAFEAGDGIVETVRAAVAAALDVRPERVRVTHRRTTGSLLLQYEPGSTERDDLVEQVATACGLSVGRPAFCVPILGNTIAVSAPLANRVATPRPARPVTRSVEVVHALEGRVRLRVRGVDAAGISALARFLAQQAGVRRATANPASRGILVLFDPTRKSVADIERLVVESDVSAWPPPVGVPPSVAEAEWRKTLYNTALLAVSVTNALPSPLTVLGILAAALPSAKRSYAAARQRRLSVDMLDLAAIVMAIGTGKYVTASFMTWLLSIGDIVLAHTTNRARAAIEGLLCIDVKAVWRVSGAHPELVPLADIRPGDHIALDAGGSVPVDGTVRRGLAVVDEKALTGESLPREREPGDRVLAATVLVEGHVVVEVEKTGGDTAAARIVQILEGVGAKPMTLQREIERKADWLVLPTFVVACAAGTVALERMTSVLITDFGTGVRISVPTSVLAMMTVAAHDGVLLKGGHYLERLAKTDTIIFDKTGTLTCGSPRVASITSLGRYSEDDLIATAAAAEARQNHPVAEAIRICAEERGLAARSAEVDSVTYTIGAGLRARVDGRLVLVGGERLMRAHDIAIASGTPRARAVSPVFVAIDGRIEGVLGIADEPRAESRRVVQALRAGGRREIILLSGDAREPVDVVAATLGIDRAYAELLPEGKVDVLRRLQAEGRTVAMVGDGINDAPALALADVGISLRGATEVALETADVVLLSGGLAKLPHTFEIADAGMRHVHRGIALVIAPNVAAMVLGAMGLLPPALAALVNNGSTVVAALVGLTPLFKTKSRP